MQITKNTNQASIKAGEVIKLIRQWKRNGVTDAIIPKLLVLYFGEPAYMNNELIYPKENFYDIRIALHFNNTIRMLVDIRRSGSFGITGNMDSMGITNFYSLVCTSGNGKGGYRNTSHQADANHHAKLGPASWRMGGSGSASPQPPEAEWQKRVGIH